MTDTVTLYYAYQGDGRVRDPFHADPDCHHLQRAAGDVRPVQVPVPVGRDVCGTCGGDVPTGDADPDLVLGDDPADEVLDEDVSTGGDEADGDSPAEEN
jgi:hypothetical protein